MLCVQCKKRQAEVNITQIKNNKKTVLSLCKQCAAQHGFQNPLDSGPFPLADLLLGMTKGFNRPEAGEKEEPLHCSGCNLSFEEFAQQGRFGCGSCYSSFRPRLEGIMRKIHGSSMHRGRNPGMGAAATHNQIVPVKEEERVERELVKAIDNEDFERAAELRDKLKSLRKGITVDNREQGVEN
jgi:protein arginine kinase activator